MDYIQADLFEWQPERKFDTIFFSFWLSHVPPERFDLFWNTLRHWLNPDGRVFLIDSRYEALGTAKDQQLRGPEDEVVTRHLNDGQTFEIVKVFYQPERLEGRLESLDWSARSSANRAVLPLRECGTQIGQNIPEHTCVK